MSKKSPTVKLGLFVFFLKMKEIENAKLAECSVNGEPFCRCILISMALNRNFTLHYKYEHLICREGDSYPILSRRTMLKAFYIFRKVTQTLQLIEETDVREGEKCKVSRES